MTTNTGKIGLGVKFEMSDGASPETFTAIGNCMSVSGPGISMEFVDATHLRSTGGYREIRPHMKSGGEITIQCSFDPTDPTLDNTTGVRYVFENRLKRQFRLDFVDAGGDAGSAAGWSYRTLFEGYVTGLGMEVSVDNLIEQPITITVDGPVTLAAY